MDYSAITEKSLAVLNTYGPKAALALGILIIGYWAAKLVTHSLKKALNAKGIDPIVVEFSGKLVFALIYILVILAALNKAGIETTAFLAAFGAAGLAVGLALQGSLSNFAAGVLLVVFRPCRVGDFVEAGGCSGVVKAIDLFSTTLRTGDNKIIVIPNSRVMSSPITNYNTMPTRRIDLIVGIGYGADIALAKNLLLELCENDERILKDPAPVIAVSELADSSVNLVLRPWVNTADYWPVRFELTEKLKLRFDENGIEIPFPQIQLHTS